MARKKKFTKGMICSVIIAALAVLVSVSIIIANIFIPVKYLSAYLTVKCDKNEENTLRVSFIDVGYGDCTLIELPDGKNILVDGGNGRRANEIKILKLMQRRGVDYIDYLVSTSVRAERCGGLAEILKYKKVGKIFMPYCLTTQINSEYLAFYKEYQKSGVLADYCEYGNGAFTDEYKFCFVSPSARGYEGGEYENLNKDPSNAENVDNASAMIWLEYAGVSFLLCGDAGSEVFDKITAFQSVGGAEMDGYTVHFENCNVLKMPNHGAANSVNTEVFDLLSPQAAIISVGENGRNLPSTEALAAAQNSVGDNLFRTDMSGTVTIVVKDGKFGVIEEKK